MITPQTNLTICTIHKEWISPSSMERHRVTVRVPDVWDSMNSVKPHRNLNQAFREVWERAVVYYDPTSRMGQDLARWMWFRTPPSKLSRSYKSKRSALKQFDAAAASGLYAKYEVVVELSVDHLTQEHDPS